MEISITSSRIGEGELRDLLSNCFKTVNGEEVSVRGRGVRLRGPDAAVTVAFISASSLAVGALITGLLQIAKERFSGRITLQGSDGSRIDIPSDISSEKLDELIQRVRTMSRPTIKIG